MSQPAPIVFQAKVTPHRSLGPNGVRWVVGLLCGFSGLISLGLWWAGAWPVVGFNGAEIGLAIWLLRRNAQSAGSTEMLILSSAGLRVVTTDPSGRCQERVLQPGWLRTVLIEEPHRPPILWLIDRAQRLRVGAELAETELRGLALALNTALDRLQRPHFDNPQLR